MPLFKKTPIFSEKIR